MHHSTPPECQLSCLGCEEGGLGVQGGDHLGILPLLALQSVLSRAQQPIFALKSVLSIGGSLPLLLTPMQLEDGSFRLCFGMMFHLALRTVLELMAACPQAGGHVWHHLCTGKPERVRWAEVGRGVITSMPWHLTSMLRCCAMQDGASCPESCSWHRSRNGLVAR